MTYKIAQTEPSEMTTAELFSELDGFKQLAVEVTERLSAILCELRARREPHAFFSHPVLRFFESIAGKTLDAEAAILLANAPMIKAIKNLPVKQQLPIAQGQEVPVASISDTGELTTERMPIFRMGPDVLKRVFSDSGIRSVPSQAEMIRAAGRITRIGMITVLKDEGVFKVGNQKLTPDEVHRAALQLGYSLVLTRDVSAKAG